MEGPSSRRLQPIDYLEPVSKRQKVFHNQHHDASGELSYDADAVQQDLYTIAWLCALPVEMAAACAMLDETQHGGLVAFENDTNTYRLGRIGRHNVVITCLPIADYGTINAANVLTNLKRTFPCIRLGLMVGIGGGAPNQLDVRLGDIVVGTRVMQYDLGKLVHAEEFRRTAVAKTPDPIWGRFLSAFRAQDMLHRNRVTLTVEEKLGGVPEFRRPESHDRLYSAEYRHISVSNDCDGCEQSKIVTRPARASNYPEIHHRVIASGNQVIKNGIERDKIARELDAVCFEMEAAGAMAAMSCLTIRGICDYADSHKNKTWQGYAAAVASAYARELLISLPVTVAAQPRTLFPSRTATIGSRQKEQESAETSRRAQILDSFRFEQMESRKMTIKNAHKRTCRWLLKHPAYCAWMDPTKLTEHCGFMWVRGKPGAGKSTIMKFLYNNMKGKAKGVLIASFFFNARGGVLEKTVSGMYRSLLVQLLEAYPDLQSILDDPEVLPQSWKEAQYLELTVLVDIFRHVVARLGQRSVICYIDALDECDEQEVRTMIQEFEDLAEEAAHANSENRFQICFSSRHYPYIKIRHGIQVVLEDQDGHVEDIANYIESRLEIEDQSLIGDLKVRILEKATGVFMWVVLVVEILNKENRRGCLAIRRRFAELPSDLSALFKDMLQRDQDCMDDLKLSIQWILYAERPLSPEEYYHAIWAGLSLKGQSDEEIPNLNGLEVSNTYQRCVTTSSKGLAEITKSKQPTVQFIHESVRDFLLKEKGLQEIWPELGYDVAPRSHEEIKKSCKAYIDQKAVSEGISNLNTYYKEDQETELIKIYPLLAYIKQYILTHANLAAPVTCQTLFIKNFSEKCPWIPLFNLGEKFGTRRYRPDTRFLYMLAERNLANLIKLFPHRRLWFDFGEERYRSPFFAALALGCHDAILAFLQICVEDEPNDITLRELCEEYSHPQANRVVLGRTYKGPAQVYQVLPDLLEAGDRILAPFLLHCNLIPKDVSYTKRLAQLSLAGKSLARFSSDERDSTPLILATHYGCLKLVRMLLEDFKIDQKDNYGRTLLSYAAESKFPQLAVFLIGQNASVDMRDLDQRTPLHYAATSGCVDTVRVLLDRGAVVDSKSSAELTPLIHATEQGHLEVVEVLLNAGASVNSKNQDKATSLCIAAKQGHLEICRILLDKSSDLHSRNQYQMTPFLHAVTSGNKEVVKLLLDRGADPHDVDLEERSALHFAVQSNFTGMIQTLVERGVAINSYNKKGATPLLSAIDSEHHAHQLFSLLLANGASIKTKTQSGQSIVSAVITRIRQFSYFRERLEILGLLIENGAEIHSADDNGRTALSYLAEGSYTYHNFSKSKYEQECQLLLSKNPAIDPIDHEGRTPLYYAAGFGATVMVKLLLERGAEVNVCDIYGISPLMRAAEAGHNDIAKMLVEKGADINMKDCNEDTALIYAARNRDMYLLAVSLIMKFLLSCNPQVDIQDSHTGRTALSFMAERGDVHVVEALLEKGADITLRCKEGQTAYDMCRGEDSGLHGFSEIRKLLEV